jgi:hypothetical protein
MVIPTLHSALKLIIFTGSNDDIMSSSGENAERAHGEGGRTAVTLLFESY